MTTFLFITGVVALFLGEKSSVIWIGFILILMGVANHTGYLS